MAIHTPEQRTLRLPRRSKNEVAQLNATSEAVSMAAGRAPVPRVVGRRPLASGNYLLDVFDEHRRASTVRVRP